MRNHIGGTNMIKIRTYDACGSANSDYCDVAEATVGYNSDGFFIGLKVERLQVKPPTTSGVRGGCEPVAVRTIDLGRMTRSDMVKLRDAISEVLDRNPEPKKLAETIIKTMP
jgi:hypothetical protein